MKKNVRYYFKTNGGVCIDVCKLKQCMIGSGFCERCENCIAINTNKNWIICKKLNKEIWRKKSKELYKRLVSLEHNHKLYLEKDGFSNFPIIKKSFLKSEKEERDKTIELIKELSTGSDNTLFEFRDNIITQINKTLKYTYLSPEEKIYINNKLNKFKNMKKENINIEIPKGYVPELKDGKITLIYKGDPLDEMPKNWEECGDLYGEWIDSSSRIRSANCSARDDDNKNIIPQGLGKPMLALIQLLQLRNKTWEVTDSKPKYTGNYLFSILYNIGINSIESKTSINYNAVMTFSKQDVCNKFMEYHKDLLWEARELL